MALTITYADVEARWRTLSSAEQNVATVFIEDLLNQLDLIRPEVRMTINTLTSSQLPVDQVSGQALSRVITKIIAENVKRVLRNPDALRSVSIGADGSIGIGYDNSPPALAAVGLSPEDLFDIDSAMGAVTGQPIRRVGSVKLSMWPVPEPDMTILPLP